MKNILMFFFTIYSKKSQYNKTFVWRENILIICNKKPIFKFIIKINQFNLKVDLKAEICQWYPSLVILNIICYCKMTLTQEVILNGFFLAQKIKRHTKLKLIY